MLAAWQKLQRKKNTDRSRLANSGNHSKTCAKVNKTTKNFTLPDNPALNRIRKESRQSKVMGRTKAVPIFDPI